ncbi:MAG: hypothetical protein ACYTFI_16565, partial [Planctomycetota bacterium]
MPNEDSLVKILLIVAVVFLLLFGGLGFYLFSQVGTRQEAGSLEAQIYELRQEIGKVRKRVGELSRTDEDRAKEALLQLQQIRHDEVLLKTLQKRITEEGWATESLKGQIAKLEVDAALKEVEAERIRWETLLVISHGGDPNPDNADAPARLRAAYAAFKALKETRQAHHTSIGKARQRIAEYIDRGDANEPGGGPCLQAVRGEKDKLERGYSDRRSALQAGSDEITKDLAKEKLRYDSQHEEKRKKRSRLETEYVQIREELQSYMKREDPEVDTTFDGVVIVADISTRQAAINIGQRHGVKANMRFEVFQLRQGGRRVVKGFVIVRDVGRETASCIIMDKAIRLPRCPTGDYTAAQPEELFCPYHAGAGGAGSRAQRLKAIPKEVNMGMKVEDPIVVGDLVGNPFFKPRKRLHFAVKGDPDNPVVREFKTEDFVAAIRWHGGIIDADLGAQTDVL